jgi:hypothetical protein
MFCFLVSAFAETIGASKKLMQMVLLVISLPESESH